MSPTNRSSAPRIFRYRHTIAGCPVWYAVDVDDNLLDMRIVRPGMDEACEFAQLARDAGHPCAMRPKLTLVT